jgi:hypothetical protein
LQNYEQTQLAIINLFNLMTSGNKITTINYEQRKCRQLNLANCARKPKKEGIVIIGGMWTTAVLVSTYTPHSLFVLIDSIRVNSPKKTSKRGRNVRPKARTTYKWTGFEKTVRYLWQRYPANAL